MKKFVHDKINDYIPYLENNYPIFLENSERLIEFNFNFDDIVTKFIEHYEALASKKREFPLIVDNSINDRYTESKLLESNQITGATTNNNIGISNIPIHNNIIMSTNLQNNNNIPMIINQSNNIQSISNPSSNNIPINNNQTNNNQNKSNNNQSNSIQSINNINQSNNNKNNNQSNNNNQNSNNNSQNLNNLTEKPVFEEHENVVKTDIVNLLQKEEPTLLSKNELIDIDGLPIRKDFSEESGDSLIHTNDKMFLETIYTKKSKLDLTHNDLNIIDGMMLNDNDLETFFCALEKNEYFEGKLLFVEQHLSDEVFFYFIFKIIFFLPDFYKIIINFEKKCPKNNSFRFIEKLQNE